MWAAVSVLLFDFFVRGHGQRKQTADQAKYREARQNIERYNVARRLSYGSTRTETSAQPK